MLRISFSPLRSAARTGACLAVFLAAAALLGSRPAQQAEYSYEIPPRLNDGWEVGSLADAGFDTAKIEALTERMITEQRFVRVRSMLIVRHGKLVHEAYSPFHQRNTLHSLASITKTFSSTLIGIAIDKGHIESVDARVVDLLPQLADAVIDPRFNDITLAHLMTMSSGIEWFEHGSSYNAAHNSEHLMVDSEDWMRYVLSRPVAHDPGSRTLYNTGGIHLLSAVIKSATGLYANEFAERHLFHPMGVRAYQWNRDPMGYPCTGGTDGGVGLRTRDLAKFGWLFLHDGTWQDTRIISQSWIDDATRRHVNLPGGAAYGYNWFPRTVRIGDNQYACMASFGFGGQNLFLVPDLDLIVAITCDIDGRGANERELVRGIFEAVEDEEA